MTVLRFEGVRYATARRFARPQLVAWDGQAPGHGPIAPQPPSRLRAAMGDYVRPQDEDCLTLTIATPATTGRRPVIVFLHGGAFLTGAGSLDWYAGARLAEDGDCVVVGVNYRLGALGWLHLPGVAEGNAGLWDMLAALRWVRAHIADFGGDPGQVTVMGQSAGGHAILCLLTLPETEGLFHRAILQSAPPGLAPFSTARAAEHAGRMCALAGIAPAALAGLPVAALLEAQMQLARSLAGSGELTLPFLPAFDALAAPGAFIEAAARAAVARGVGLIIGTTREESHAFVLADPALATADPQLLDARFAALAGAAGAIERYRRRRPGGRAPDLLADLLTDHDFLFPSIALAQAVADLGGAAFVYQFNWAAPGNPWRACHCIELPFVFDSFPAWANAPMLAGAVGAEMEGLSAALRGAWTAFARTGDPATPALPWPRYARDGRMTMLFDGVLGVAGDPAGAAWRGGFGGE